MAPAERVRIGVLASRLGVSTDVLRAWERRFDLFAPSRTPSGYRLYGAADEARARQMLRLREDGVPLAVAAAQVLADGIDQRARDLAFSGERIVAGMLAATSRLDGAGFAEAWSRCAGVEAQRIIDEVAMPFLRAVGDAWECGDIGVAHEHFASNLVRAELLALGTAAPTPNAWAVVSVPRPGRGRRRRPGPVAVLACPAGEHHDMGALALAALLPPQGWQVRYLGADTPLPALRLACTTLAPDLVVLAATRRTAFTGHATALRRLAATHPVAIGGAGADADVADELGAHLLPAGIGNAARACADLLASVGSEPVASLSGPRR